MLLKTQISEFCPHIKLMNECIRLRAFVMYVHMHEHMHVYNILFQVYLYICTHAFMSS